MTRADQTHTANLFQQRSKLLGLETQVPNLSVLAPPATSASGVTSLETNYDASHAPAGRVPLSAEALSLQLFNAQARAQSLSALGVIERPLKTQTLLGLLNPASATTPPFTRPPSAHACGGAALPVAATPSPPPLHRLLGGELPTVSPADTSAGKKQRFKPFHEEKWTQRLDELRLFRMQHGHCHVPHCYEPNKQLARWVKRQRRQFKLLEEGKPSTMTIARAAVLEDLGFVWDSHEAAWGEKIQELRRYRERYGDTLVPSTWKKNPQLAVWVKCQRRQYKLYKEGKPCAMTKKRVEELEAESFCWEVRPTSDDVPPTKEPKQQEETQEEQVINEADMKWLFDTFSQIE